MHQQKLVCYGGNYDQYVITRREKEEHQRKAHQWEQVAGQGREGRGGLVGGELRGANSQRIERQ